MIFLVRNKEFCERSVHLRYMTEQNIRNFCTRNSSCVFLQDGFAQLAYTVQLYLPDTFFRNSIILAKVIKRHGFV